ncbi:hypothetical protein P7K49_033609 [Saguinus oedipus]|uniref:Uncharacterized protein n=1 Tax=Saguinus oedipus TaxID=9490 RepID=A0ABQ9TSF3_SAGOE|nr:hypothetical protein P7K49_033609 [Saguinus oedipus]
MPKKFQGENTKSAAARARRAEAKAAADARKQKELEDAYWKDDDKHVMRKEQRKVRAHRAPVARMRMGEPVAPMSMRGHMYTVHALLVSGEWFRADADLLGPVGGANISFCQIYLEMQPLCSSGGIASVGIIPGEPEGVRVRGQSLRQ